jgi:hypothetical protein
MDTGLEGSSYKAEMEENRSGRIGESNPGTGKCMSYTQPLTGQQEPQATYEQEGGISNVQTEVGIIWHSVSCMIKGAAKSSVYIDITEG